MTVVRKANLALRSAIALSRRMCWYDARWSIHMAQSLVARMVAVRSRS